MMELLIKLVVGAIVTALCAVVLRRSGGEFAAVLVLAAGVWMLTVLVQPLGQVVTCLARLARLAELDMHLIEPVVKVVGLSIIARIASEVCRGAGEGGIAAFVELAGTILALAAALPLINAVVDMIAGLLG